MTLNDFGCNTNLVIAKVNVGGKHARRLYEMGFLPGTPVTITHKAPLGYPVSVSLRGYELILGFDDANALEVELNDNK
ncbi:MAG: ferrous iron transport protein A [Succinivibrionaceae bacterium]